MYSVWNSFKASFSSKCISYSMPESEIIKKSPLVYSILCYTLVQLFFNDIGESFHNSIQNGTRIEPFQKNSFSITVG